jgi:acyl-coenzyme A synthetase/AMP-(fatty) acid ligase
VNGAGSFPWNVREEGVAHLSEWLKREDITVYRSVPSVFRQFVSNLIGNEEFPKLRLIMLTGEPVYRTDIELFNDTFRSDAVGE